MILFIHYINDLSITVSFRLKDHTVVKQHLQNKLAVLIVKFIYFNYLYYQR